jgi:hypothetical protein
MSTRLLQGKFSGAGAPTPSYPLPPPGVPSLGRFRAERGAESTERMSSGERACSTERMRSGERMASSSRVPVCRYLDSEPESGGIFMSNRPGADQVSHSYGVPSCANVCQS